MANTTDLDLAASEIEKLRRRTCASRAVLVAISGIDGSGKGFVSDRLASHLKARGWNAVVLHADGWLHLPHKRFGRDDAGRHFYEHAFRVEELMSELVLPLRDRRSRRLEFDYTEETATSYRREFVEYRNVDVVLLECIFLMKRRWQSEYDHSFWIDCTFETALERAIARAQEGLTPAETIHAYETIYFPAQRIHFEHDRPREAASWLIVNDHRLGGIVV